MVWTIYYTTYHVATIIEKSLPAWKDVERYLKHKQKIKDRGKHQTSERKSVRLAKESKANMIEPKMNKEKVMAVHSDFNKNKSFVYLSESSNL